MNRLTTAGLVYCGPQNNLPQDYMKNKLLAHTAIIIFSTTEHNRKVMNSGIWELGLCNLNYKAKQVLYMIESKIESFILLRIEFICNIH